MLHINADDYKKSKYCPSDVGGIGGFISGTVQDSVYLHSKISRITGNNVGF